MAHNGMRIRSFSPALLVLTEHVRALRRQPSGPSHASLVSE